MWGAELKKQSIFSYQEKFETEETWALNLTIQRLFGFKDSLGEIGSSWCFLLKCIPSITLIDHPYDLSITLWEQNAILSPWYCFLKIEGKQWCGGGRFFHIVPFLILFFKVVHNTQGLASGVIPVNHVEIPEEAGREDHVRYIINLKGKHGVGGDVKVSKSLWGKPNGWFGLICLSQSLWDTLRCKNSHGRHSRKHFTSWQCWAQARQMAVSADCNPQ